MKRACEIRGSLGEAPTGLCTDKADILQIGKATHLSTGLKQVGLVDDSLNGLPGNFVSKAVASSIMRVIVCGRVASETMMAAMAPTKYTLSKICVLKSPSVSPESEPHNFAAVISV